MRKSKLILDACPFCGKRVAQITTVHELEECGNFESEECPCELYENAGDCGLKTVVCDVQNGGCGASTGYWFDEAKAVWAWNRRVKEEDNV